MLKANVILIMVLFFDNRTGEKIYVWTISRI